MPATDHHFVRFPGAREAQRDQGGTISADPAVEEMLRWLREVTARPASTPAGGAR